MNKDYFLQYCGPEIDNSILLLTNQPEKAVSMGRILENNRLYSVYDNETKIYFTAQMIELSAYILKNFVHYRC